MELLIVVLIVNAECCVHETYRQEEWQHASREEVGVRWSHQHACEEEVFTCIVHSVHGNDDSLCFISDLDAVLPRLVGCIGLIDVEQRLQEDDKLTPISQWPHHEMRDQHDDCERELAGLWVVLDEEELHKVHNAECDRDQQEQTVHLGHILPSESLKCDSVFFRAWLQSEQTVIVALLNFLHLIHNPHASLK